MNTEIIKFYESFDLSVARIIEKRPKTINKAKVEIAIEEMYGRIKRGKIIKPISIPREIWLLAEKTNEIDYIKKVKEMEDFRENFEKYHKEFKTLKIYIIILIVTGLIYAIFKFTF